VVWSFLATASALHLFNVGSYLWRGLVPLDSALSAVLGLVAYHGFYVFVTVGLLVRPDRPRDARDLRAAAHDALLVATGAAFLLAYGVLLVPEVPRGAAYALLVVEEAAPAALAAFLSWRLPGRTAAPYRFLAVGLGSGALLSLHTNWMTVAGLGQPWEPFDVAWSLPALGILAAAAIRTPQALVAASEPEEGSRGRLAALAVAAPPLVDLGARSLDLPGDAFARSLLALSASAVLALLAGLRLRPAGRDRPHDPDPMPAEGANELARLAFGTAHELNNPLMAVVVSAELAVARGGAEEPLRALQHAAHDTAAGVRRLQGVAASRGRFDTGRS
jgi:signal transduction histidine kinase